jgi:tripartite-type tricarboxylate transporter receptor subunit TctC
MLASSGAMAQQPWPAKPIRFVAPFAPGGGTDFIGRVAAQKLTEAVKQLYRGRRQLCGEPGDFQAGI